MAQINISGLQCLQALFAQTRRQVNFDALMTEKTLEAYKENPAELLLTLADQQQLKPEQAAYSGKIADLNYAGPLLVQLKNESWVLLTDSRQLEGSPSITLLDPSAGKNLLSVPADQFHERFSGTMILFRNLAQIDAGKQTLLTVFALIARQNNTVVEVAEIAHKYAVGDEEIKESLFQHIASDYQFKSKKVSMKWAKLQKSTAVMPCIAKKKSGKYAILCGLRDNEGTIEAVLLDPEVENNNPQGKYRFLTQEQYEEEFSGKYFLLKKIYRLNDEEQPFSLAWFIPEFIKNKAVFGQIALSVLMLTIFSLVTPLFFQIVVDKVLVNQAVNTLNVLGIAMLLVILFNTIVSFARSYLLLFAANKIDISTATKIFAHLMRLPVDFFERIPAGVLLKHMQQNEKIRGFLSGNLFFTILDVMSLLVFIPFLLFYSTTLTFIVLGFSAMMAVVIACLIKPFQKRLDELYRAEGKRQSMLVESIHGIRTVKSLALEPVEKKFWDNSTAYAIKSCFRVGKISITAQSLSQMLEMMMTICVIWVGAHLVFNHTITIGALIAFQMLSNRVTAPLVKMVGLIHEYQQIALSIKMLGVVMNTPAEPAGGGVRNPVRGQVDFENVSFRYRPDLPFVLKNYSLGIQPGMTVGFVGRSGSGKTTVTKLLQGLYNVTQGVVKIDGIDIREIEKSHLRRNIGIVLQENYFFSGTVRDNIAMPKQNATLQEIIYVAKLSGADEFIQKLPRGYETVLEENASNLSGGQKQRLAIARALLTNPPILIFDEATSALDPESEEVIRKNLKAIAKGRTVLIVSHRLSIVAHADKIVVINEGELADSGTHAELVQRPGIYQEFWNQQMNA